MNKLFISIIGVLLIIIFLTNFNSCGSNPKPPTIKSDTIIVYDSIRIHDTLKSKPKLIKIESIKWDTIPKYIPDTTLDGLKKQYKNLGDSLFSKKIYSKKYNIDTFGTLVVDDTVFKNNLIGQSISYDLKIPKKYFKVTNTVTIPCVPTNQLYIGGGVNGNKNSLINSAEIGLILKTKKDRLYQFKVSQDISGYTNYGVGTYWKIKF